MVSARIAGRFFDIVDRRFWVTAKVTTWPSSNRVRLPSTVGEVTMITGHKFSRSTVKQMR